MAVSKKTASPKLEVVSPLVLAGEPGFLQGNLSLRNKVGEKVKLRDLKLTRAGRRKRGEPEFKPIDLPRLTVRPNAHKDLAINVALPASTRAGVHHFELAIEGVVHAVEAIVAEVVDLEIISSEYFLEGPPGATFEKSIVFVNHGNQDVNVGKVGAVQLDLDMLHCRALRAALKALADTDGKLDDVTAALAKSYQAELDSFAPLRVTNDPITVAAGESVTTTFKFQIPDKIPKRVQATASIQILSETLTVHVLAV